MHIFMLPYLKIGTARSRKDTIIRLVSRQRKVNFMCQATPWRRFHAEAATTSSDSSLPMNDDCRIGLRPSLSLLTSKFGNVFFLRSNHVDSESGVEVRRALL